MKQIADDLGLAAMCRILGAHPSGYYRWRKTSANTRDKDDRRLPALIKHSSLNSTSVSGHRKVTTDMREPGDLCSGHRLT